MPWPDSKLNSLKKKGMSSFDYTKNNTHVFKEEPTLYQPQGGLIDQPLVRADSYPFDGQVKWGLSPNDPGGGFLTKSYADTLYVNTTGDEMTGDLTIRSTVGSTTLALSGTALGQPALEFEQNGSTVYRWHMPLVGPFAYELRLSRYFNNTFLDDAITVTNPPGSVANRAAIFLNGDVILPRDPQIPMQACTKQYTDLLVTAAQQLIGRMDASTGLVQYTLASGHIDGELVDATVAMSNHYVIVDVAGTPPIGPPETQIIMNVGDWLLSDGTQWFALYVGSQGNISNNIAVVPPIFGGDNVYDALLGANVVTDQLEADKVNRAGDTMTGELIFGNDGQGVTFAGFGRLYKVPGGGMVLRESSGGQQPQFEDNNGTNRRDILDTLNGVRKSGDTMTGSLVVQSLTTSNNNRFIFQKSGTVYLEEILLEARTGGARGATIQYDGGLNRSDEGKFHFYTENGGYSWGKSFNTTIAPAPGISINGDSSAQSHTNRSEANLKHAIRYDEVTATQAFDALRPAMFKLNEPPWPPVDSNGDLKPNPNPKPENRDRFGFIVDDMVTDPMLSLVVNQDYTTKQRGWDLGQVIALTVAKVRALEAELARVLDGGKK